MNRDDALTTALIGAISHGLPLVSRPYAALAEQLNCSEQEVIDGIRRLSERGDLKRFGVVVRHRRLGYQANAMVVWDIPDTQVEIIGRQMSGFDFVTLCYRRPRRPPVWPYNLFCMIHGRDRDAVGNQVDVIANECGLNSASRQILFSRRCFKQRGAAYQRARLDTAPQPVAAHG